MKIFIIGDNTCAELLAESLSDASHDVTVIGENPLKLAHIEGKADVTVIESSLTNPTLFTELQAQETDLILCVSLKDESNITACLLGRNTFQIPSSICLLRSNLYEKKDSLLPFDHNHLILNPNKLASQSLVHLLNHPGSHEVVKLEEQGLVVITTPIHKSTPICGQKITELESLLQAPSQILAVIRNAEPQPLDKKLILQENDYIIFAEPFESKNQTLSKIIGKNQTYQSIMITGATPIAEDLIQHLKNASYYVILIEKDYTKAANFAEKFPQITVLHADPNDTELLENENIEKKDVFLALSEDDEDNLVSALQAKTYQVPLIVTVTQQPRLVPIIEKNQIHAAIAPESMLAKNILNHLQHPQIIHAQALRKHGGHILVVQVPKKLADKTVQDICLPLHAICFGLQRGKKIIQVTGKSAFQDGDLVCLYTPEDEDIGKITHCFT